ncbi:hypothetical protein PDL71_16285 [Lacibacter sp. MH-610]|uniref:hypothetical protein n=1 Tax=Lacibacter sp. MH-610 TaxID=3020883 RepID=UPI00389234C7
MQLASPTKTVLEFDFYHEPGTVKIVLSKQNHNKIFVHVYQCSNALLGTRLVILNDNHKNAAVQAIELSDYDHLLSCECAIRQLAEALYESINHSSHEKTYMQHAGYWDAPLSKLKTKELKALACL